jgi:dTDP-4-dehydrorhamnose reductase
VHPRIDSLAASFVPGQLENSAPILITGAHGTLGRALAKACAARGLKFVALSRSELDITDEIAVFGALDSFYPWAVINTAGYVRVDDAESECGACYRANSDGPANLARACASREIALATFSTDLVFDGGQAIPYTEHDSLRPLNTYGASKADGEARVLALHSKSLVIRTSAFFGDDDFNFVVAALRAFGAGIPFVVTNDTVVSPTYVPDLANATLDLVIDGERGVWHLANVGETSWAGLASRVAIRGGYDPGLVTPVALCSLGRVARIPRYSVLGSARGSLLPPLDDALDRFFREATVPEAATAATC